MLCPVIRCRLQPVLSINLGRHTRPYSTGTVPKLQARRLRKALEHAIRPRIQSRAARCQTELDTSAPRQAVADVRNFKQHKWHIAACADHDVTLHGARHQVLRSPLEQQLLNAADLEQSRQGLLPTKGPGAESAHGAWSDHATSAESARAMVEVVTASTTPDIQKLKAVHIQSVPPGSSDARDNVLFEEPQAWSEQCNNGQDSQETIQRFQMQMEDGLQSMQLELQKFKADVLAQLHALQLANAGKSGARAKSQKANTQS